MVEQHPDANRLIVELATVYVQCDDCGHYRFLGPTNLKDAGKLGVATYRELCRKLRCAECPPVAPKHRNMTIRPTWRADLEAVA